MAGARIITFFFFLLSQMLADRITLGPVIKASQGWVSLIGNLRILNYTYPQLSADSSHEMICTTYAGKADAGSSTL